MSTICPQRFGVGHALDSIHQRLERVRRFRRRVRFRRFVSGSVGRRVACFFAFALLDDFRVDDLPRVGFFSSAAVFSVAGINTVSTSSAVPSSIASTAGYNVSAPSLFVFQRGHVGPDQHQIVERQRLE